VWGYDETMIKQNTFHVVMSQRNPNVDTFDNFPTPPWAFFEGVQGRHLYSRLNFKLNLVAPAKWRQLLNT